MIGTGISVRKGMQMSLDIWGKRLKGIPRVIMDLFSCFMVLVFCGVIMVQVIQLIQNQITSNQVSPALHVPMYLMSFSIFVGMLFLCLVEFEQIVKVCRSKGKDPNDNEEKEAAE